MIHARDDPLVSYDWAIDWDLARANQHIITCVTQRGGHVGFHEWKGWLTGLTVRSTRAKMRHLCTQGLLASLDRCLKR
jgi:predicted alpha/beta-fold hydrolase